MATCPKGHDSATVDYCDTCGTPITAAGGGAVRGGPTGDAPPADPGGGPTGDEVTPAGPCPVCGTPKTGRFCEEDGYDFLLAPPVQRTPPGATSPPATAGPTEPAAVGPATPGPEGPATPGPEGPMARVDPAAWHVVVGADRAYYDLIMGHGGEDAGTLTFPRFVAQRRFPLTGGQLLIGRRSRSRGAHPDIDLVGPPEDPGVSHLHALLVAQPSGWAVVDLESANGTYLNDPATNPIASNKPVPVKDGDRIYVGAWTLLTIHCG